MKIIRVYFLVFSLVFFYSAVHAQTVKLNVSNEETTMTVSGTSTLHDWTSEVKTVDGYVEVGEKMINKQKIKKGEEIPLVEIIVPVKAIISPRGATMDNKTYNALKSESHPEIKFKLENCKISEVSGTDFQLNAAGNLTIAGVTKKVEFPVSGKLLSSDKMSFAGAYKLNMVDYDMEPPSAMFGQIETGEEVEIKFELVVVK
jgi:hypothetical protein